MGRHPKELTDTQRGELETLAALLTQDQIADYFGITRPTLAAMMDRDEDISLRYKKGKAKAIAAIAQNLIMQAREGNLTAQIFYLKTQAGWRETQAIEHTGKDGGPIETADRGAAKLAAYLDAVSSRAAGKPPE